MKLSHTLNTEDAFHKKGNLVTQSVIEMTKQFHCSLMKCLVKY